LNSIGGAYTSGTTLSGLSSGALLLNGVSVGASLAADDNSSSTANAASAIAKAAAINKVANLSGVYAKAGPTTVSGTSMTAAALSGTIAINGVLTDTFTTTTDTSFSRAITAAAINAKTAITGVTAVDTGDDLTGVTLTANDGRNINLVYATLTAAATGTGTDAATTIGSYSLYTMDGKDINVSSSPYSSSTEAFSGLRTGTYNSSTATVTTFLRTSSASAPASSTTGLLNGNTMVINGVAIGAAVSTDDTASDTTSTGSTRAASAIAIAAAINKKTTLTGVSATAAPNILRGTGFTAGVGTPAGILLNGVTFTVNAATITGVIDAFNSVSGKTGVVASQWGEGVQLTAADGRNISISSSIAVAALGLTGLTIGADSTASATAINWTSQVTLSSANKFTIAAGTNGAPTLEKLGFRQGVFGGVDNGTKVNQIDISTSAGAGIAISAIDAAINTVSAAQAKSGAINNRLDMVVNNLSEASQNMQASRSRILDTDYATETTSLAKQQIISQAATAMLAQANQSSQSILSLLK
jgi:flagellin